MNSARNDRSKGFWLFVLLLCLAVFNYPFVLMFNTGRSLFGIPLLVLYFFGGWLLFIVVIYRYVCSLGDEDRGSGGNGKGDS